MEEFEQDKLLEVLKEIREKYKEEIFLGKIEIQDISLIKINDAKEIYKISLLDKDPQSEISEQVRDEYYSRTSSIQSDKQDDKNNLSKIQTYSDEQKNALKAINPELYDEIIKNENERTEAENDPEKVTSLQDLIEEQKKQLKETADSLDMTPEEVADFTEFNADDLKYDLNAESFDNQFHSQEIEGNQYLDTYRTLNEIIGENYDSYKFVKTSSGQNIILGINKDGSAQIIDNDNIVVANEPLITLMRIDNGQTSTASVVVAFKLKDNAKNEANDKLFGVCNRDGQYASFYARGGNNGERPIGRTIDSLSPKARYDSQLLDSDQIMDGDLSDVKDAQEIAQSNDMGEQKETDDVTEAVKRGNTDSADYQKGCDILSNYVRRKDLDSSDLVQLENDLREYLENDRYSDNSVETICRMVINDYERNEHLHFRKPF